MNQRRVKPKSIVLGGSPQIRVFRTFEDWQAEQALDLRTPEQRGIHVGSLVMWRHRDKRVIVTERATVVSIDETTLTLLVKDVKARTCDAEVNEIVNSELAHATLEVANRRAVLANQLETPGAKSSAGNTPFDASELGWRR